MKLMTNSKTGTPRRHIFFGNEVWGFVYFALAQGDPAYLQVLVNHGWLYNTRHCSALAREIGCRWLPFVYLNVAKKIVPNHWNAKDQVVIARDLRRTARAKRVPWAVLKAQRKFLRAERKKITDKDKAERKAKRAEKHRLWLLKNPQRLPNDPMDAPSNVVPEMILV